MKPTSSVAASVVPQPVPKRSTAAALRRKQRIDVLAGRIREPDEAVRKVLSGKLDDSTKWGEFWNRVIEPQGFTRFRGMEALVAIYLDGWNRLIEWTLLGIGIKEVTVQPQAVLLQAEELKAYSYGLIHNHPSGNAYPSPQDFDLYQRMEELTASRDFCFHDSVIMANGKAVSTRGLMQPAPGKIIPWPGPTAAHRHNRPKAPIK